MMSQFKTTRLTQSFPIDAYFQKVPIAGELDLEGDFQYFPMKPISQSPDEGTPLDADTKRYGTEAQKPL